MVENEREGKRKQVWITSSSKLSIVSDLLPSNLGRQSLITSLIKAYELDQMCEGIIGVPTIGSKDLEAYHDREFVEFLLKKRHHIDNTLENKDQVRKILESRLFEDVPKSKQCTFEHSAIEQVEHEVAQDIIFDDENDAVLCEEFGLLHDCYVFPFMADYVKLTASSSIASAKTLVREKSTSKQNIAINWYGGRHHCTKRKAAGYCYINDIILAISVLRKSFGRVFYFDLDLHHGDGVELAYDFSKNVSTCSIHRYGVGFYPGTGSLDSSKLHKYNIPTKRGLSDSSLLFVVKEIVIPLINELNPGVLVIQCGCDGLASDPNNEWNLTIRGLSLAVEMVVQSVGTTPVLILGGGGYNHTETAKCWAFITKNLLQCKSTWDMLPEHPFLDSYEKDGFQFWTPENEEPKKLKDENTSEYLNFVKDKISSI